MDEVLSDATRSLDRGMDQKTTLAFRHSSALPLLLRRMSLDLLDQLSLRRELAQTAPGQGAQADVHGTNHKCDEQLKIYSSMGQIVNCEGLGG
ncbi:hypothetical protein TESG_05313 [Trichophyton tonsurans CBS 112818]|uniref:Uncharacterized protein n=1 Tax=Trichophyton tonsurans (strain CBS 112818) TaxID=647933 RepID=F2S2W4_TRIT1|nr:hypothetical protein TESG_05313 [Trichophyton tonsurans CBS 112818]